MTAAGAAAAAPGTPCAQLRAAADEIWAAQHAHPFVRGIADGTLPVERFRHYIRQDYVYLVDYGRLMALGAARAPDLATMRRFAELTQGILVTEMDLHRALAAEWGVGEAELEREPASPTTRAYADFLLRTAALGDFAELLAALLPCMWGYAEIGARLAAEPEPGGGHPGYARWIATYAGEEFQRLAAWCRELTDRAGAGVDAAGRRRMEAAFVQSSRWELAFWDAAWRLEGVEGGAR